MVTEGKGLARHEGMAVFVEGGVPGDLADLQIVRKKRDYAIAKIQTLLRASELRVQPFCRHFELCGGCKWQYLPYEQQAIYKSQIVIDTIKRVGKLEARETLPIVKAEPNVYYRNKMEYTFSNKRWLSEAEIQSGEQIDDRNALGLHIPGMFDKIVDIEHCHLQAEPANEIRNEVRRYALEHSLSFYDLRENRGLLRNLIIRTSTLGELMVIVSFGEDAPSVRLALMEHLSAQFPQITSLHYVVNPKRNDTLFDLEIVTHRGRGHIFEQLGDLKFKISPKSFFQTNPHQAVNLYEVAKSFAHLKGSETVYDLYTGTGSIALFLANDCKKVVGIEEVEAAIIDAKFNAELNGVSNAHFYAGDVKEMFTPQFAEQNGAPDVLITDPPRAGMHPDVVRQILHLAPPRLVYVSCNPATQARDLHLLSERYELEKMQPVDMFPHTYHIENVAALNLKTVRQ